VSEDSNAHFAGKVAVINGGTQGLGKAAALQMIDAGLVGLVVSGRNRERGEAALKDFNCEARFVSVDLAEPEAADEVIAAADEAFGRIDVLVNSAASTGRGSIWNTDVEIWDNMLNVNVRAPGLAMTAAAKVMRREGIEGSMVNIGSVSGYGGQDFLYPYAASKGGLMSLTRNAAFSLMRHRIRVNQVNPGWMNTPSEHAVQKKWHDAPDNWLEEAGERLPFGRLIEPAEVARTICLLASGQSGLMTGSIIDFDQTVQGAGDAPQPSGDPVWGETE